MVRLRPLLGDKIGVYPIDDLRSVSKTYTILKFLENDIYYDEDLKKIFHNGMIFIVLETAKGEPKFYFENKGWYFKEGNSSRNYKHVFDEDERTNELLAYVKYEMAIGKKGTAFEKLQKELYFTHGEADINKTNIYRFYR